MSGSQQPPRREIDIWFRQQYEYLQNQIVDLNRQLASQIAESYKMCSNHRDGIGKRVEMLGDTLRHEMGQFQEKVRSKVWLVYMALLAALLAAFFSVMRDARSWGDDGPSIVGPDKIFQAK